MCIGLFYLWNTQNKINERYQTIIRQLANKVENMSRPPENKMKSVLNDDMCGLNYNSCKLNISHASPRSVPFEEQNTSIGGMSEEEEEESKNDEVSLINEETETNDNAMFDTQLFQKLLSIPSIRNVNTASLNSESEEESTTSNEQPDEYEFDTIEQPQIEEILQSKESVETIDELVEEVQSEESVDEPEVVEEVQSEESVDEPEVVEEVESEESDDEPEVVEEVQSIVEPEVVEEVQSVEPEVVEPISPPKINQPTHKTTKDPTVCPICKGTYVYGGRLRHEKTKKHLEACK
jgi:hypothetical protein